ncbi:hypothetical protein AGMMS49949_04280 [Alphaproteobacteria bacterium]|nr:hypothetical protein AGMMS49949_04280 [Alphaproteobacteria bacterium]GHS97042.1 hypothetical protein AGMMS50296_3690 [Alphaproteobacteria bacterium]
MGASGACLEKQNLSLKLTYFEEKRKILKKAPVGGLYDPSRPETSWQSLRHKIKNKGAIKKLRLIHETLNITLLEAFLIPHIFRTPIMTL